MIVDDEHRQIFVENRQRVVPNDRNDVEVQRFPSSMTIEAVAARRNPERIKPISLVNRN